MVWSAETKCAALKNSKKYRSLGNPSPRFPPTAGAVPLTHILPHSTVGLKCAESGYDSDDEACRFARTFRKQVKRNKFKFVTEFPEDRENIDTNYYLMRAYDGLQFDLPSGTTSHSAAIAHEIAAYEFNHQSANEPRSSSLIGPDLCTRPFLDRPIGFIYRANNDTKVYPGDAGTTAGSTITDTRHKFENAPTVGEIKRAHRKTCNIGNVDRLNEVYQRLPREDLVGIFITSPIIEVDGRRLTQYMANVLQRPLRLFGYREGYNASTLNILDTIAPTTDFASPHRPLPAPGLISTPSPPPLR